MKLNDITQHEIEALKHTYNVSDAHTHQSQSPTQRDIIRRLPELWYQSEQSRQYDMEQRFLTNFFRVRRQPTALKYSPPLLVYAASIGMAITANFLKKKRLSVGLMHPCFDNLVDLLKHFEVPLSPISESVFHDPDKIYAKLENEIQTDAIFIVDPNNPTGFTLFQDGRRGWQELIRFAKDKRKILIFDFCFSSFMLSDKRFEICDVYEMLEDSGVSYIAMEDTGKTWPLQDAKASILKTSADLYDEVYNIHTAYLLNVSPFILNMLTEYILDSERDNFASVMGLLNRNREIGNEILAGSLLQPLTPNAQVSVLWCEIKDHCVEATVLKQYLTKYGIHLLPGTYFYWADHEEGQKYVRIALARNSDVFTPAMRALRLALDAYEAHLNGGQLKVVPILENTKGRESVVNLEQTTFLDRKELEAYVRSRREKAGMVDEEDHTGTGGA